MILETSETVCDFSDRLTTHKHTKGETSEGVRTEEGFCYMLVWPQADVCVGKRGILLPSPHSTLRGHHARNIKGPLDRNSAQLPGSIRNILQKNTSVSLVFKFQLNHVIPLSIFKM